MNKSHPCATAYFSSCMAQYNNNDRTISTQTQRKFHILSDFNESLTVIRSKSDFKEHPSSNSELVVVETILRGSSAWICQKSNHSGRMYVKNCRYVNDPRILRSFSSTTLLVLPRPSLYSHNTLNKVIRLSDYVSHAITYIIFPIT